MSEKLRFLERLERLKSHSESEEIISEILEYLREIAQHQNLRLREELVEKLDLFTKEVIKTSLLILAAEKGDLNLVKLLVELGVDLNYQDRSGKTALMLASRYGHAGVASLLIAVGADVNLQDNDGWTALMFASLWGYLEMVRILVAANADLNLQSNERMTALKIASHWGYEKVVRLVNRALSQRKRKIATQSQMTNIN